MAEKEFKVTAVDQSGETLFDGKLKSLHNGFFEIWLPRDRRIELSVMYDNLLSVGHIGTFDDSATCLTTFHLR